MQSQALCVHVCNIPVRSGKYCLAAGVYDIGLFQSFYTLFHDTTWTLRAETMIGRSDWELRPPLSLIACTLASCWSLYFNYILKTEVSVAY